MSQATEAPAESALSKLNGPYKFLTPEFLHKITQKVNSYSRLFFLEPVLFDSAQIDTNTKPFTIKRVLVLYKSGKNPEETLNHVNQIVHSKLERLLEYSTTGQAKEIEPPLWIDKAADILFLHPDMIWTLMYIARGDQPFQNTSIAQTLSQFENICLDLVRDTEKDPGRAGRFDFSTEHKKILFSIFPRLRSIVFLDLKSL